ncbi:MAG: Blue-light-activated histidine kinase [Novosphingobium sp.]|nr:Blue-light-activated histidine kinase [Novosphingobium sp.]
MKQDVAPSFEGDAPAAAETGVMLDRRELALVALERTRMPIVITDPRQPDGPIVLANQAFMELTGYSANEVLGHNCRFLQGPDTAGEDVELIRNGLRNHDHHVEVELLNYRKDGSTFWNQLVISAVHAEDGELLYYFASQKDVTSRREAKKLEESERLLLKEIDHRSLNALALVQSIVRLSRTDSVERFAASIKGRVDALARAHRLLALSNWIEADLGELIAAEGAARGLTYAGPPVGLPPHLVQPLSLVFHELFSNAREHGGLSRPEATTAIEWEAPACNLVLRWTEGGVLLDSPSPPPSGLGLQLVGGIVTQQLGGTMELNWRPDGLSAEITMPWAA